jgi:hypothetical protein
MRGLFINTSVKECGVYQYGLNLHSLIQVSALIGWEYWGESQIPDFAYLKQFDVILYNWAPLIDCWIKSAPFDGLKKQALIYHDGDVGNKWDAILFSDPTMTPHDNWHPIGRPIPNWNPYGIPPLASKHAVLGVHGFIGAWADQVVARVVGEFEYATVRLHLPFSKFCDPDGSRAKAMADRCRAMVQGSGVAVTVAHDFMDRLRLIEWLNQNDLNCYIRPGEMNWRGVSSAPDYGLAAHKPICVNRCNAFRHLHHLSPSICVEDLPMEEIIRNGLTPLVPLYQQWGMEQIRKQVEDVLLKL